MEFISSSDSVSVVSMFTKQGECRYWNYGNMIHWYFPFKSPSANEWGDRKRSYKKSYYRDHYKKLFKRSISDSYTSITHNGRRASLIITSERSRLLDRDNFIFGFKPIIDSMRDINILKDDNPRWLDCCYYQRQSRFMSYFDIYLIYKGYL